MTRPTPIYRVENCSFSFPLQWSLTAFWRTPTTDSHWLDELQAATEPDGIRVLGHRFLAAGISQFAISTKPHVPPKLVVQRVKGRLQYLIRDRLPKAWRRNFAIRSVGKVTRADVENYVASQLARHRMAERRVQARFGRHQIIQPEIDLSRPRRTTHGQYRYNLHVVLVRREGLAEIRNDTLARMREMILRASAAKGYLLSHAGILADHVHLEVGCPFDVAPDEVAVGFLNNLAFAHGMKAVFQYGAFVGTFGEYTNCAMKSASSGWDQRSTEASSVVAGWC